MNNYQQILLEAEKSEKEHQLRRDEQTRAWFKTHPECRHPIRIDDNDDPIYMGRPEKALRDTSRTIDLDKRIGSGWWARINAGHVGFDHFSAHRKTEYRAMVRSETEYQFPKHIEIQPDLAVASAKDWVAEDKVRFEPKEKLTKQLSLI